MSRAEIEEWTRLASHDAETALQVFAPRLRYPSGDSVTPIDAARAIGLMTRIETVLRQVLTSAPG